MTQTTRHRLWGLAEKADWGGWPPKFFWRWLLRKLDREHGHELDYD